MSSRIKNTGKNITSGILNRIVSILLPFINRTAILQFLGAEYTGLSGLFGSILHVLSISELGFNTAVVYCLYAPIASNDEEKICVLLSMLKRIYRIVGIVIFALGIFTMPFLRLFIHGEYPKNLNIYLLFSLYLFNSGISYFLFAYKETILIADQRQGVSDNIRTIVSICVYIGQLFILIFTKNFYFYIIANILGNIITNLLINRETSKRYPYLHDIAEKILLPDEVKKQVSGLLINRVCDTFRNSFDNLIISSTLGLVATAIYGNYYYIYGALYSIMLVICNAMKASVGNSIVVRNEIDNYNNFLDFSLIFSWILGWSTITLACLYQPFMCIWAGKDMMLNTVDMFLFVLYFYLINMNNIRNQYISGTGIWWNLKWSYIVEAILNLILNIILGRLLGITGVLLATIITIFFFNYMQRNSVLFKCYFKSQDIRGYYKQQFYYMMVAFICLIGTYALCMYLSPSNNMQSVIVRFVLCAIVPNVFFLFFYRMNSRWISSKDFVLRILNRL